VDGAALTILAAKGFLSRPGRAGEGA
jgi:hypothetical protein